MKRLCPKYIFRHLICSKLGSGIDGSRFEDGGRGRDGESREEEGRDGERGEEEGWREGKELGEGEIERGKDGKRSQLTMTQ